MTNFLPLTGAQGAPWTFYQHVFHFAAGCGAVSALVSAIAGQKFSCTLGVMLCGVSLLGSHAISQFLKETQQLKVLNPTSTNNDPKSLVNQTETKVDQLANSIQTLGAPEQTALSEKAQPARADEAPPKPEQQRRSSTGTSPLSTPEILDPEPIDLMGTQADRVVVNSKQKNVVPIAAAQGKASEMETSGIVVQVDDDQEDHWQNDSVLLDPSQPAQTQNLAL